MYNLIIFMMKEGASEEQIAVLEASFERFDSKQHPLLELLARKPVMVTGGSTAQDGPQPKYIPSWWRGDAANAKVAMGLMKSLPQ